MGYIKHHAIIITGWQDEELKKARSKAIEIFDNIFNDGIAPKNQGGRIVSDIQIGLSNGFRSFFIAPDGSKEGWSTSNNCNDARSLFIKYVKEETDLEFLELEFGGDDGYNLITKSR